MTDTIVQLGNTGMWGRIELAQAWEAAGRPALSDAGRLYKAQKDLYDGWKARKPGFNPADNPDDETQRLAHVRFAALDIRNASRDRAACERAGLIFPYDYEPWHCELPNVRRFAIVRSLPSPASSGAVPFNPNTHEIGEDMFIADLPNGSFLVLPQGTGKPRAVVLDGGSGAGGSGIPRLKFESKGSREMLAAAVIF